MSITIQKSAHLSTIQQQFHEVFPHIKLEYSFMSNTPLNYPAVLKSSFPHVAIGALFQSCKVETFQIEENMTVEEVENAFWDNFRIPIKLYVREGAYWLKSAVYNSLSLKSIYALSI